MSDRDLQKAFKAKLVQQLENDIAWMKKRYMDDDYVNNVVTGIERALRTVKYARYEKG